MNRPQRTVAVIATAVAPALVLVGCGAVVEEPADPATTVDAAPGSTGSSATPAATGTAADGSTDEASDDRAGDGPASTASTDGSGSTGEETAYPADPVAYADALVAAWAGGDTTEVAALAVDGDDLGDRDAVVGVDHLLHDGSADAFHRLTSPVNDYVDTFHHAMTDRDEAVLERLGTDRASEEALAFDPAIQGTPVITDHGFLAFEGEPLGMLFRVADQQGHIEPETRVLELAPEIAAAGGSDGVARLDVITSARWY